MKAGREFVIVTPSHVRRPLKQRTPLKRLIIPKQTVFESVGDSFSLGWWVEATGGKFILRARLSIEETHLEGDLRGTARWVIWELDTDHSERLTWPWQASTAALDVTKALTDIGSPRYTGFKTGRISHEIIDTFNEKLLSVASTVSDYPIAAAQVKRLMRSTLHERPLISSLPISLTDALLYVRSYFARSELIELDGVDPYFVAAAVVAGFTTLPKASDELSGNMPAFRSFESARVINAGGCAFSDGQAMQDLGTTQRHEDIVAALAEVIRSTGFRPMYNKLVDLRVERGADELFFEVKTADRENFSKQVRSALAQLLEYRYRCPTMSQRETRLVAVIEAAACPNQHQFAYEFLRAVGVELVLWNSKTGDFEGLDFVLAQSRPSTLPFWRFPGQYSVSNG